MPAEPLTYFTGIVLSVTRPETEPGCRLVMWLYHTGEAVCCNMRATTLSASICYIPSNTATVSTRYHHHNHLSPNTSSSLQMSRPRAFHVAFVGADLQRHEHRARLMRFCSSLALSLIFLTTEDSLLPGHHPPAFHAFDIPARHQS